MKQIFESIKQENRAALALYVPCGDPTLEFTQKLVKRVCQAGVDIIELGVPFSDPMADGEAVREAATRALKNKCALGGIFKMVENLRADGVQNNFVLFSYYNPIFKYGLERAATDSAKAGIDAWLVVDIPLEESQEITSVISKYGIDFIPLVAPATPADRAREISKSGSGFLYYASVSGLSEKAVQTMSARVEEIRRDTNLPIAMGFGDITTKASHSVAKLADIVVVGSQFVDAVHNAYVKSGEDTALDIAEDFVKNLASSVKK